MDEAEFIKKHPGAKVVYDNKVGCINPHVTLSAIDATQIDKAKIRKVINEELPWSMDEKARRIILKRLGL